MRYEQQYIIKAFQLYTTLTMQGFIDKEDVEYYLMNEEIQSLLEQFAAKVDAVLIHAGEILYLVPTTALSIFHVNNEYVRREIGVNATNADVYMMYFCILIFIGEFYNSYQVAETQRDFLIVDEWLLLINTRIEMLQQHEPEELQRFSEDLQYNWSAILEKWEALNDLKESANTQKGNTISRLSFLHKVLQFMKKEKLIEETGIGEYTLTEKTKIIVQRYFMELEYNHGILQFMYQYDERKDEQDASHI